MFFYIYLGIGLLLVYLMFAKMEHIIEEGWGDFEPTNIFEAEVWDILDGYQFILAEQGNAVATFWMTLCTVFVLFGWSFIVVWDVYQFMFKKED